MKEWFQNHRPQRSSRSNQMKSKIHTTKGLSNVEVVRDNAGFEPTTTEAGQRTSPLVGGLGGKKWAVRLDKEQEMQTRYEDSLIWTTLRTGSILQGGASLIKAFRIAPPSNSVSVQVLT